MSSTLSYRTSIFKSFKDWVVLDAVLKLNQADPGELRAEAPKESSKSAMKSTLPR